MLDPASIIQYGGLLFLALAVFCQTGLFFCFFVPSGGMLFTAGVLIATGDLPESFLVVSILLSAAAWLGNMVGYWFGLKAGPVLYRRKDSRFFKRKHLAAAEAFYQKHGNLALAAGLFLPIIRSFAPVVSGMIGLSFRRFLLFTAIGSVLWVTSILAAGYLIGTMPFLKPYLTYIVIGIVVAVTAPIVVGIIRNLNKAEKPGGNQ